MTADRGRGNPAPERRTGPAPERRTGPAPERKTGPAPERRTGPAPERASRPADELAAWAEVERRAWTRRLAGRGAALDAEALEALRVERVGELGERPEVLLARAAEWVGWRVEDAGEGPRVVEAAADRKRSGAFYTPRALARPTVERVLSPLVRGPDGSPRPPDEVAALRICDPACGAGAFLLEAFELLAEALEDAVARHGPGRLPSEPAARRRLIAERSLFGVDRDRGAVAAARRLLRLASGGGDPGGHLAVGDALVGVLGPFDVGRPARALERDGGDERDEGPTRRSRARALGRLRTALLRGDSHGPLRLPAARDAREAADRSVAWWFWPTEALDAAPLADDSVRDVDATLAVIERLVRELRPLHWWLEFPAVAARGGFDAVVGNPPWETVKGLATDFFRAHEADYAGLGAPESRRRRRALFDADPGLERAWIDARERTKAYAHWFARVADDERARAAGRPFLHRGAGDLNGWKLFLELGLALLRPGGRLGQILPAALLSDAGARDLRRLLLDGARWEWAFGFENRDGLFPIHRSFKFAAVVAERGGRTEAVRSACLVRELAAWEAPEPPAILLPRSLLEGTRSGAFPEVGSRAELELLEHLAAVGRPLVDAGFGARFSTELHSSHDAAFFDRREALEARGVRAAADGSWLEADWRPADDPGGEDRLAAADGRAWTSPEDVRARFLPVLQGAMIAAHDANAAGHLGGHGRRARFAPRTDPDAPPRPQYLADERVLVERERLRPGLKLAHRRIAPATNARTLIAAAVGRWPTLDSLFLYSVDPGDPDRVRKTLALVALFDSFVVDWQLRRRLGGINLSQFVIEELCLPPWERVEPEADALADLAARLGLAGAVGASLPVEERAWAERAAAAPLAAGPARRRAEAELDARAARLFGLEPAQFEVVFAECDHPAGTLRRRDFRRDLPPKGFWRVDRELPPAERRGALARRAFAELGAAGASARAPSAAPRTPAGT